jgi:hypothetical protein
MRFRYSRAARGDTADALGYTHLFYLGAFDIPQTGQQRALDIFRRPAYS